MTTLRVVDIETTGTEPPAELIELGWVDVIDGVIGAPKSRLFGAADGIPPETMAVHHIRPADIEGLPLCTPGSLARMTDGVTALVAHNCAFERLWLDEATAGAAWICTYKVALRLWPDAPRHGNQVLRYWRGLTLGDEAMPPHRAGPDAFVTAHLLAEMLKETSVEQMVAWTQEPKAYPTLSFGKHRGLKWPEVPGDYLLWMTRQGDMDPDAKWCAERELERRKEAA